MMDTMNMFTSCWITTLFLISDIKGALGLHCYECSSVLDSKCGIDWKFEEGAGDKYKVLCSSQATACQKIVGEIQGSGDQHVYRLCWNQTTVEPYTPTGCEVDDIRGGELCRCTTDICNGQRPLQLDGVIFITFFICAEAFRLLYFLNDEL